MQEAYRRVLKNKGASASNGVPVDELKPHCKIHWPSIRETLVSEKYKP